MTPTPVPGRVVLVRHGETEWTLSGRHTGTTDIGLTPHGHDQARALGEWLRGWRFAQIRTSPLRRASQTARIAGLTDPAPVVDPDLAEWDYGDYEGLTSDEIHRTSPGWTIFADDAPGGETADDVGTRVDRVLAAVRPDIDAGGDVALVAHGHLLRVLAARWLGQSPRFGAHLGLDAGAVCILGSEHGIALIARWNHTTDDVARR